ncbi:MAG: ATP-binding protein [Planctomycetota bacterium]
MATVLVVDDSNLDRTLVTEILSEGDGIEVQAVEGGQQALEFLAEETPDLVLTDLVMPEPNGLQLVRSLKAVHPKLPVILMTSQGSEEIAMEALRAGAASYVPKASFGPELLAIVEEVLELARERQTEEELYGALVSKECSFELNCETRLLRPLVKHLQRSLSQLGWCDESMCMQLGVALSEALQNALEHGNLEVSSERRQEGMTAYQKLLDDRCRSEPYCHRRIRVAAHFNRHEARFTVADDGPGFDPGELPDPREAQNLERLSGRGVLLMRTFMDEVSFNDRGNIVTMIKRNSA